MDIPRFATQEMLAYIDGLTHETFRQWIKRGVVLLSVGQSIGRGHRALFSGADVAQLAMTHELARQGFPLAYARHAWLHAALPRLLARQYPMPGDRLTMAALFHVKPDGTDILMRTFHEDSADEDPAGLELPDAPHAALLFRTDRFLDEITERMRRVGDAR